MWKFSSLQHKHQNLCKHTTPAPLICKVKMFSLCIKAEGCIALSTVDSCKQINIINEQYSKNSCGECFESHVKICFADDHTCKLFTNAIARSVMQNCITIAAFMRLTVDGVDILNADDELRVVNAAKSTKQYKAHAGPVYNAAEFLQIVHNNKVIFKYVDD